MAIIVTVRVDADPERVGRVEADNPELVQEILAAAEGRMKSHQRFGRVGETLDIDEYDSVADYEAFYAEALPAIERLGAAIGTPYRDTVYEAR
jgi:hypothetical protein